MAELKNDEEEHALPAKRKPDAELESKDAGGDESTLKKQKSEEEDENNSSKKLIDQVQDEEDDEEEEEDYEHEDSDDDEEESEDEGERPSREAEFHHKGKGILKEDPKGKGKLVEEADDSSDDDDDDDDSDSDDGDDSDLSDDPLAEVDLDNILPSRTRRCGGARPGLAIAKDDNDA